VSGGGHELVVIGASWGGLSAIREVLQGLPPGFGAAVVVVQHRSAGSHPSAFRDLLGAATTLVVTEAEDKQPLERGRVYAAPPDFHTLVDGRHLALSVEAAVGHSRPSIDVLFTTAAEAYRERCVGVDLTGANADGAAGLSRVVELGGAAVVQDPATAERAEMPAAALAAVPSAQVAPPAGIASLLAELCPQEVHA
jgi:two-component system, chemotaxis family, protein-glutamate methylesterase/glutaminase